MIKTVRKLRIEGNFLKLITSIIMKCLPLANIIVNSERLKAFSLRAKLRQGWPTSPTQFSTVVDSFLVSIRYIICHKEYDSLS